MSTLVTAARMTDCLNRFSDSQHTPIDCNMQRSAPLALCFTSELVTGVMDDLFANNTKGLYTLKPIARAGEIGLS